MKKILFIFILILSFESLANTSIRYVDKFSSVDGSEGILDKYQESVSIISNHDYKDLQLIITNKDSLTMFSIIIEPNNWQIIESNTALIYIDGKEDNSQYFKSIGAIFFRGTYHQEINLVYENDNFKKFIESNEFEIKVKNLIIKVDLKKLPLSKLKLN